MKRRILAAGLSLLLVLSLLTQAAAVVPGGTVYFNTRQIANNLQYINTVSWDSKDGRGESYVLRYSAGGDVYPIVAKDDSVYSPITISEAISYAESRGKNVLAAFNSDFFSLQTGVPFGIFIEDGVYKSSPEGKNAVSIDASGGIHIISAPSVGITLNNQGGIDPLNAGKSVSLTHFNKFRTDTGGLYMFSEHFSTVSTRTTTNGWFVKFRIIEGTPSVSGTMTLEVAQTLTADGAIEIGEGYLVLSAATAGGYIEEFNKFAVGDVVTLTTTCNEPEIVSASFATGGGDMLVSNGIKSDTSGWDALLSQRHPRTALGIRSDGTVVCYTIDGRDTTQSVGLLPNELADEMLRQGCVSAINLDGGGSTAINIRFPGSSNTLVNKPSDGKERKCSTYIMFVTDAVPDGRAKTLSLKNDGAIVLAGSSIELSFGAADSGFRPVTVPQDISATPVNYGASVTANVYTAGDVAGTDSLSLQSNSTGAYGSGNIVVITEPTSITVTEKGSTNKLTTVQLLPGQSIELDVIATYYRRSVTSQVDSFEFTITGDIGEMTEPGVFTAAYAPGTSGTITVSAGGTKADIRVELGGFDDMVGHWAADYVSHLSRTGVVKGISDIEYGPELDIKRGDFVLMLYRAAGEPVNTVFESFDDVPSDSYYAGAIAWAKANSIAAGTGDGKFAPASPLTRQQAFTFVYRALGILNISFADGSPVGLTYFTDHDKVADYAVLPTATLVDLRVVEGSDGKLTPGATLTRAQMAKILSVVLRLPKNDGIAPFEEVAEQNTGVDPYDVPEAFG